MKSTFAIATIAAVSATALQAPNQKHFEFMQFVANHGKNYKTTEEYAIRLERYLKIDAYIVENNADPKSTHTAAHNFLSDSTEAEYQKLLGTREQSESDHHAGQHEVTGEILGATKNWTGSCSTPVKDQGQCGSCWSFAGTEVVESGHCIKSGTLLTLSTQQNVDCNKNCYGCDGGWAYKAFQYLQTSGAELNSDYPYTAKDGTCKYSASKGKVNTTGYKSVAGNNSAMMSAINGQPVAVAINASSYAFQSYSSGVMSGTCSTSCNHAVVAVGYNSGASTPYWIVRNSWGSGWGNGGFIWMTQNGGSKGQCGINTQVNYPTM